MSGLFFLLWFSSIHIFSIQYYILKVLDLWSNSQVLPFQSNLLLTDVHPFITHPIYHSNPFISLHHSLTFQNQTCCSLRLSLHLLLFYCNRYCPLLFNSTSLNSSTTYSSFLLGLQPFKVYSDSPRAPLCPILTLSLTLSLTFGNQTYYSLMLLSTHLPLYSHLSLLCS